MAKRKKKWISISPKKPKHSVPEELKAEVTAKAQDLIETKFKPYRLELDKSAEEHGYNYVVDMYTKWWRSYFYFCSKYRCPSPRAISEYFDVCFTRMEYVGGWRFNLAYMRHTGQWWEVYRDFPLEKCFKTIEGEQIFWP